MSIVTLQLGQCGNQIGRQFFETIVEDLQSSATAAKSHGRSYDGYEEAFVDRFFTIADGGKWTARAVMVDMEPKVIAQTITDARRSGVWQYGSKSDVCERRGSGNNWAYGYCRHGSQAAEPTLDAVRRMVEQCDRLGGFFTHMSLAGGTGSGVGSHLTRSLRDHYPHSFIVNQVVWPYTTGEVIVQNYNAVLSLAHLNQTADAIIALENDALQKICTHLLAIPKVSFQDINRVIARQLTSILAPVTANEKHSLLQNQLGDMVEQLVPHPAHKLVTPRSIPNVSDRSVDFTTYQWPGLLRHLRQMLVSRAPMEEGIDWQVKVNSSGSSRSVSNLLIVRGKDAFSADCSAFLDPSIYSQELLRNIPGGSVPCGVWRHERPFLQHEKSAVLITNGQSTVTETLDRTIDRAWRMFASRAYLHQYTAHGLSEEDFVDCFAALEQLLSDYKRL